MTLLGDWQNPDGGWGYYPAKNSWLEPTVYSALALARDPGSRRNVDRAWALVRCWQNADGGWRPAAKPAESCWVTALALTLGDILGDRGAYFQRGTNWLVESTGADSSFLNRTLRVLGARAVEREVADPGWPWRPGTSAWVEPTAHALVALRKVLHRQPTRAVAARINSGERMLLSLRSPDGGWNYGSPRALGIDLPSYPETTALALIGLQQHAPSDAVERALGWRASNRSPLACAWLDIALDLCSGSRARALPPPAVASSGAILHHALTALDSGFFKPGASA